MFHKRKGQLAAILMLLSVSAQPMISHASEPIAPVTLSDLKAQPSVKGDLLSPLKDFSFDEFRHETRGKISETRRWIKNQETPQSYKTVVRDLDIKIDRFQDRVKPAGRSLKTSLKSRLPGKGLVYLGDRKVSVYGLLLMMAFAFVLLMLGLSNATSRLGGRH